MHTSSSSVQAKQRWLVRDGQPPLTSVNTCVRLYLRGRPKQICRHPSDNNKTFQNPFLIDLLLSGKACSPSGQEINNYVHLSTDDVHATLSTFYNAHDRRIRTHRRRSTGRQARDVQQSLPCVMYRDISLNLSTCSLTKSLMMTVRTQGHEPSTAHLTSVSRAHQKHNNRELKSVHRKNATPNSLAARLERLPAPPFRTAGEGGGREKSVGREKTACRRECPKLVYYKTTSVHMYMRRTTETKGTTVRIYGKCISHPFLDDPTR